MRVWPSELSTKLIPTVSATQYSAATAVVAATTHSNLAGVLPGKPSLSLSLLVVPARQQADDQAGGGYVRYKHNRQGDQHRISAS